MSNEELQGRIAALEVIAMTALGLQLANVQHDPDYRKSNDFLSHMREAIDAQAASLPLEAQKHATNYGRSLLEAVASNLRFLRGEDGSVN
jgi:hypothetical protein